MSSTKKKKNRKAIDQQTVHESESLSITGSGGNKTCEFWKMSYSRVLFGMIFDTRLQ